MFLLFFALIVGSLLICVCASIYRLTRVPEPPLPELVSLADVVVSPEEHASLVLVQRMYGVTLTTPEQKRLTLVRRRLIPVSA